MKVREVVAAKRIQKKWRKLIMERKSKKPEVKLEKPIANEKNVTKQEVKKA